MMPYVICLLAVLIPYNLVSAYDQHQQVFTHIYDHAIWGTNSNGEGFSGGGSLPQNCKSYIGFLQHFMQEYNITSVVDAGCGDWEFSRYIDWSGITYVGYDVVESVIQKNIEKFSNTNIHFRQGNILTLDLPPADLLLCKHVLQHLRNQDIIDFCKQLSKYKYCLITNEVNPKTLSSNNDDIAIGGGHKIDLSKAPFNIPGSSVLHFRIGTSVHQVFLVCNEDL